MPGPAAGVPQTRAQQQEAALYVFAGYLDTQVEVKLRLEEGSVARDGEEWEVLGRAVVVPVGQEDDDAQSAAGRLRNRKWGCVRKKGLPRVSPNLWYG